MKTLPKFIEARTPRAPGDWQIPAVIHQTFKSNEVPDAMHDAVMSWVEANPEYAYRFHDDTDALTFLEAEFGGDTVDAYGRIVGGAFKADFWRACMLFKQGGVYADIDTVAVAPLATVVRPQDRFVSAVETAPRDCDIYNCFMCAAPGHPFMEAAIARSTQIILTGSKRFDGYLVTGPGNVGRAVNRALGRPEETPHIFGDHSTAGQAYRLLDKVLASPTTRRHLAWDGAPVLYTEYESYRDDLEELGLSHWRNLPFYTDTMAQVRALARRILKPFRK